MPKKSAQEKTVAVIFTIPAALKAALYKKIKDGGRSRFVTEVLARALGHEIKVAVKKEVKIVKKVVKKAAKKVVAKEKAVKKSAGKLFGLFK